MLDLETRGTGAQPGLDVTHFAERLAELLEECGLTPNSTTYANDISENSTKRVDSRRCR